jgi:hypothetical protein
MYFSLQVIQLLTPEYMYLRFFAESPEIGRAEGRTAVNFAICLHIYLGQAKIIPDSDLQ